jgi:predicted dehydrogenase
MAKPVLPRTDGALAVVGGGRWARVYLAILAGMDLPFAKIVLISRHGGEKLAAALAKANAVRDGKFAQAPDLESALDTGPISAAIVVNAARLHADTARVLLARNIAVLVEKPAALTEKEASELAAASAGGAVLHPALALVHCAYVWNFAAAIRDLGEPVQSVRIDWCDPADERRYGEIKQFDASLGVVEDGGPHIVALLSCILGRQTANIESVAIARGGFAVDLQGRWGDVALKIMLERQGAGRGRTVICKTASRDIRLDFASEPGTIALNGTTRSADPAWPHPQSPLALQILAFLCGEPTPPLPLAGLTESIAALVAPAARKVREAQWSWLLSQAGMDDASADRLVAMREVLAPLLAPDWQPGDNPGLDRLALKALPLLRGNSAPEDIARALAARA